MSPKKYPEIDLVVHHWIGQDDANVSIYGTPEGLKTLASKLVEIADTDQEKLDAVSLPIGEGLHMHYTLNAPEGKKLPGFIIGRLDAKGTGSKEWYLDHLEGNDE
jgi:hypothetical protein